MLVKLVKENGLNSIELKNGDASDPFKSCGQNCLATAATATLLQEILFKRIEVRFFLGNDREKLKHYISGWLIATLFLEMDKVDLGVPADSQIFANRIMQALEDSSFLLHEGGDLTDLSKNVESISPVCFPIQLRTLGFKNKVMMDREIYDKVKNEIYPCFKGLITADPIAVGFLRGVCINDQNNWKDNLNSFYEKKIQSSTIFAEPVNMISINNVCLELWQRSYKTYFNENVECLCQYFELNASRYRAFHLNRNLNNLKVNRYFFLPFIMEEKDNLDDLKAKWWNNSRISWLNKSQPVTAKFPCSDFAYRRDLLERRDMVRECRKEQALYRLKVVTINAGASLNAGHYVSCIFNDKTQKMIMFNDDKEEERQLENVVTNIWAGFPLNSRINDGTLVCPLSDLYSQSGAMSFVYERVDSEEQKKQARDFAKKWDELGEKHKQWQLDFENRYNAARKRQGMK
jgi:hypothetical protein